MKKTEAQVKKEMKTDYPLIPMSEITDEARLLAIAWVEGYEAQGMDIPGKQKLASDIMNYARRNQSPSLPNESGQEEQADIWKLAMDNILNRNISSQQEYDICWKYLTDKYHITRKQ